jgi:hypothetical protein
MKTAATTILIISYSDVIVTKPNQSKVEPSETPASSGFIQFLVKSPPRRHSLNQSSSFLIVLQPIASTESLPEQNSLCIIFECWNIPAFPILVCILKL